MWTRPARARPSKLLVAAVLAGAAGTGSPPRGTPRLPRRALVGALTTSAASALLTPARASADTVPFAEPGSRVATPRGAAALLRERAKTGVTRTGSVPTEDVVIAPGRLREELRGVDDPSTIVELAFSYPRQWSLATGPNIDVRDLRTSDAAFVLATPLPAGKQLADLPSSFFIDVLFSPEGKFGQYGQVDDRRVVSSRLVEGAGGVPSRVLDIKFAALSFNYNLVERRLLLRATAVGGGVYMLAASTLNTRYSKMSDTMRDICDSFDVHVVRASRAAPADGA